MPTFHYHTEALGRARGRSAVAAAAYRAGERLRDERRGRWYDFRRRRGVAVSELALPAQAPRWLGERSRLWNHAEACESRANARVAREVRLALPRELSLEEQTRLVRNFVAQQFLAQALVVDWNIHLDKPYNPHAHLLLTVRRANPEGLGPKDSSLNTRKWLTHQRIVWAQALNCALAEAGVPSRVDHRSLRARGIARRAGPLLGPGAWALEQRAVPTARGRAWIAADRTAARNTPLRPRLRGTVRGVLWARAPRVAVIMETERGRLERAFNRGRAFKPLIWPDAAVYEGRWRGWDDRTRWAVLETTRAYVVLPWDGMRPAPQRWLQVRRGLRRARAGLRTYRQSLGPGRERTRSR